MKLKLNMFDVIFVFVCVSSNEYTTSLEGRYGEERGMDGVMIMVRGRCQRW